MLPRHKWLQFPNGMQQKDHILRIARGAAEKGASWSLFIAQLERYVDDEKVIDEQPLYGWWQLGGPYLTHKELEEAEAPAEQSNGKDHKERGRKLII